MASFVRPSLKGKDGTFGPPGVIPAAMEASFLGAGGASLGMLFKLRRDPPFPALAPTLPCPGVAAEGAAVLKKLPSI